MLTREYLLDLIDKIKNIVPIDKVDFHIQLDSCKQSVEYSAPELFYLRYQTLQETLFDNMPKDNEIPTEEWQYDIMSLISNKSKEDIKKYYNLLMEKDK